jgi:predicted CoA-binding protein
MALQDNIGLFLSLKSVAVVGASRDREKYGNIVFRKLLGRGVRVFPVNPSASEIEGIRAFPSLSELPEKVEGAVVVVPPDRTELVVREAAAAGITAIWLQPGAESREALRFCEASGICLVWNACILVESKRAPSGR